MDFDLFVKKVKEAKPCEIHTAFFKARIMSNKERTFQIVYSAEKCSKCGVERKRGLRVSFKEPHRLTLFEADMLYAVFVLHKRPKDYANYHKCKSGKKFIENIKEIDL